MGSFYAVAVQTREVAIASPKMIILDISTHDSGIMQVKPYQ